jgi:hypothetical protein
MDKEKLVDDGFLDMGVCCPECQGHLVRVALGNLSDNCIVLSCRNMNCSLCDVRWKRPTIKLVRVPDPEPYTDADVAMALRMVLDFPVSSSLGLRVPLCEGEPVPPEDGLEFVVKVLKRHLRQIEARMNGGER